MDNFTQEQVAAIKNYLTAKIALNNHIEKSIVGYDFKFSQAAKESVAVLEKVFTQEEAEFITSAAYHEDLVRFFMKEEVK